MISQKTVARLDLVLRRLFVRLPQTAPLWTWEQFRDALYAREFDVHLLDYIEQAYGADPKAFLPLIHNGTIPAYVYRNDGWGAPAPGNAPKGRWFKSTPRNQIFSLFSDLQNHSGRSFPPPAVYTLP